ncbi:MAG: hypothetical protein AAGG46_06275, partial [Planctomycetota bacterium]
MSNARRQFLDLRLGQAAVLLVAAISLESRLAAAPAAAAARVTRPTFSVQMPQGRQATTSPASGLSLLVEAGPLNGYGYRTVRLRFDSPIAAPGDRQLTVKLSVGGYRGRRTVNDPLATVEKDFELPAGATRGDYVIHVPQYEEWRQVWWDVWVDGVLDPPLSRAARVAFNVLGRAQLDTASVLSLFEGGRAADLDDVLLGKTQSSFAVIVRDSLPEPWIGLSSFDAVLAETTQLQRLQRDEPDQFEALCRWVAAGGSLWIAKVADGEHDRLSELLGVDRHLCWTENEAGKGAAEATTDAEPPSTGVGGADGPADGWRWAWLRQRSGDGSQPVAPPTELESVENLITADIRKRPRPPGRRAWFAERQYGFGVVLAFMPREDVLRAARAGEHGWSKPFAGTEPLEAPPFVLAGREYLAERTWAERHGLAPDEANNDFSNLLVPGVGLAPVIEFQVLITLFVVVVGPVTYWLLKQRQRTHLMVFTVPLSAATLTAALLLYAVLADGFGTTVRVRAVTLLDQPSGEHATWGRLSYYAGLAPSEGLTIADDSAMYPLLPGWNDLGMAR